MTEKGENWKVVSIAVDLTGKKLIDEMCHIAACHNDDKQWSQYVMPHRDISRSATRLHGIKIFISYGRYRVLRDTRASKNLKTKSEYSALQDLMDWLKDVKGDSNGLILVYHDNDKHNVTPFLLGALEKYKMLDSFFTIVQGFVNCSKVAQEQPELKDSPLTLRALFKKFVNVQPQELQCAQERAKITYQVLKKMLDCDEKEIASKIMPWLSRRDQEMESLKKQQELAVKVKSLRPIFIQRIRKNPKERNRAVQLRRYLIDDEVDYDALKEAYEKEQKEGVVKLVEKTSAKRKSKDATELVEIIVEYYKNPLDMNSNCIGKEIGQGEPNGNGNISASSTDSDEEEYEEAKETGDADIISCK